MQNTSTSIFDEATAALQSLIKKSKPVTSTTMKSAVVALYTADATGQLRYSNCIGLLELDTDRQLKTFMLRLYNMQTISLVFEIQLYYGFAQAYRKVSSTFYIFEYTQGLIGFLFRNQTDADIMYIKIKSNSPKMTELKEIQAKKIKQLKQKKQEGSFFNVVKGFFSDKPQQPKKQSGQVISVSKGISFDIKTGRFNTDQIPDSWQQVFSSLNISKQDLNNKQITNLIAQQTILHQVKMQAQHNQDKNLQAKIRQVEQQQKQYFQACRQTALKKLPPPPPLPPLLLTPPPLAQNRTSFGNKRANLMQEIRNNNIKLKHVSKIGGEVGNAGGVSLDISNMNNQQRNDHVQRLRLKLQMRKQALNRRQASDDQD